MASPEDLGLRQLLLQPPAFVCGSSPDLELPVSSQPCRVHVLVFVKQRLDVNRVVYNCTLPLSVQGLPRGIKAFLLLLHVKGRS